MPPTRLAKVETSPFISQPPLTSPARSPAAKIAAQKHPRYEKCGLEIDVDLGVRRGQRGLPPAVLAPLLTFGNGLIPALGVGSGRERAPRATGASTLRGSRTTAFTSRWTDGTV